MDLNYDVQTNGTDNHLLLLNLRNQNITGSKVEYILEQAEVSVTPGSFFGKSDYFRVCYTTEKKLLLEALKRISNAFTLIK